MEHIGKGQHLKDKDNVYKGSSVQDKGSGHCTNGV